MLRAIGCERVEASGSTSSKGERSPEKANDLYCLLNKKRIRRERREETEKEEREGRRFEEGRGGDASGHEVSLVTTATEKCWK